MAIKNNKTVKMSPTRRIHWDVLAGTLGEIRKSGSRAAVNKGINNSIQPR
jgi:hypothetical protein